MNIVLYSAESYENPNPSGAKRTNNLQASANAYQYINKQLGSWYEEEPAPANNSVVDGRIKELERKQEEAEQRKTTENEQLAHRSNFFD